jgi:hypothetical protein
MKDIDNNKYACLIFFLYGFIVIYLSGIEINRDGLLYLDQAKNVKNQTSTNNLQISWLLYPYLINLFHHITSLSYIFSAKLINLLFLTFSFFFINKILIITLKDQKVVWISLILLMTTSSNLIDGYLPMVIRDHGFYFFIILALYYLFLIFNLDKFTKTTKLHLKVYPLFMIAFSSIMAAMFRFEGIVYFIFFLLMIFFSPYNKIKFHFIFVLPTFFLIIFYILNHIDLINLGYYFNKIILLKNNIFGGIEFHSDNMHTQSLLDSNLLIFKFISLLLITINKLFNSIGFIYIFFFVIFFKTSKINFLKEKNYFFLISIIFLNLFIVYFNLLQTNVISGRYYVLSILMFHCLFVILTFHFINQNKSKNPFFYKNKSFVFIKKISLLLIILFLIYNFFDNLYDRKISTDLYLADRLKASFPDQTIFTDNVRINFYLGIDDYFSLFCNDADICLIDKANFSNYDSNYSIIDDSFNEKFLILEKN